MGEIEDWTGEVHQGDARDLLPQMPEESAHLVVTSPPYNLEVDYGEYDDNLSQKEYREMIFEVFSECYRVLKRGGRLAVVVGIEGGTPCFDTPGVVKTVIGKTRFQLREKYVWKKGPSESSSAWGSWRSASNPSQIQNHEEILVFYKGTPAREDKKGHTMNKEEFMESIKSVWEVKASGREEHPAAYTPEIPRRLIKLYSFPDDVVIDPFMGVGTTGVVAERQRRRWVGMDLDPKYVNLSEERIQKDREQSGRPTSLLDTE